MIPNDGVDWAEGEEEKTAKSTSGRAPRGGTVCPRVHRNSVAHLFSLIWWHIQNLNVSANSAHVWIYFSVCDARILAQLMWRILSQSLAIQKSILIFLGSCHHYQWNIDFVICIQIIQHDIHFILWCINKWFWGRFPHVTHNGCSSCPSVPKLMPLFPKVTDMLKTEVCFLPSVNLGRFVEYMNYIH